MSLKAPQQSLKNWGKQKWRTSSGKPSKGKRRYLPDAAWKALSPGEKAATNRAKAAGTRKGKQFVKQLEHIGHNMAEYQGKTVKLNTPRPIRKGEPGHGRKKSVVFVRDGERIKRVMFGDPNMPIRKDNPAARKNFRARHNCDNPGPKTKARYWSCKAW